MFFPNPSNDSFTVELKDMGSPGLLRLVLLDPQGRTVFERKYERPGSHFSQRFSKNESGKGAQGAYHLVVEVDGARRVVLVK